MWSGFASNWTYDIVTKYFVTVKLSWITKPQMPRKLYSYNDERRLTPINSGVQRKRVFKECTLRFKLWRHYSGCNYRQNYAWWKFCYRLLAALAPIVVCSIYIGQLLWDSPAPLIKFMCKYQRGVAYAR